MAQQKLLTNWQGNIQFLGVFFGTTGSTSCNTPLRKNSSLILREQISYFPVHEGIFSTRKVTVPMFMSP